MTIKSDRSYIFFLGLLATAPPMATDMYLPAIPDIARHWRIDESLVNLSLVLFFVSFSVSLLFYGPLSDKYGRKPVLRYGLLLFSLASFLCAFSLNIGHLIFFRIMQGIGAGAPSSMSMAICRDHFEGKRRQQMFAYIGVVLTIMPMLAPSMGSFLLAFFSWRFIFGAQGFIVMISFVTALFYSETAKQLNPEKWFYALVRYKRLFQNREYMLSNSLMGLLPGPFFAYLSISPIIYINIFHLSKGAFSIFFGLNAVFSMMGALFCARLVHHYSYAFLLPAGFAGYIAGGLMMLLFGGYSPYTFFLAMITISFFLGMSRPISTHLVLEQVHEDIGAASSFFVFYQMMIGALCMLIASLPWSRPIAAFGVLALITPIFVYSLWPGLLRRLERKKQILDNASVDNPVEQCR